MHTSFSTLRRSFCNKNVIIRYRYRKFLHKIFLPPYSTIIQKITTDRGRIVIQLKTVLLFFFLFLSSISVSVLADRGMIPMMPDVSVYEPGQKAIIAWNGQEEILILSTDVSSTENTTVLEILPLPSNPRKIEEASLESFDVIQDLILINMYMRYTPPPGDNWGNETVEVEVVFHEKIGMHDITVVEARNVSHFAEWMDEFLLMNGISQQISLSGFDVVIEDYMSRGFHFYVLDLVELSSDQKSVEPILYEFDTTFLYYPLLITSPIGGDGKITLFLLTEDVIESGYHPLTKARYHGLDFSEPIQFEVSNEALSAIDPRIGELFDGKAWMTVLIYEGPLGKLKEDMTLTLLKGDVNVDGQVDITDIVLGATAFGSYSDHPKWNPAADMNSDGVVDIYDIVSIARNFGKTREVDKTEGQTGFQTISKGYYSGQGEAAYYVIENEDEWTDIWNQHRGIFVPQLPPPEVNFSGTTVIAVFMGEFNTGGYEIEIKEILDVNQYMEVKVEKTYPGKGCAVTLAFSQPYHIVKIEKSDKEITFDTLERTIECT